MTATPTPATGPPPGYRRDPEGTNPPLDFPDYRSTRLRHPHQPLVQLPHLLTELTGPVLGPARPGEHDNDLTNQHAAEPLGQRIVVSGRLLDGDGHPVPDSLVEVWQANACGRYRHTVDRWPAPLDPNFDGVGRTMTNADGRYEFTTIRPGAYPWHNHRNAWRPAHIHFSVFGRSFTQRLVTQMYFPGDPLLDLDPVLNSIPDRDARRRLVSTYRHDLTVEEWALGYQFDIVLRGRRSTPFEGEEEHEA